MRKIAMHLLAVLLVLPGLVVTAAPASAASLNWNSFEPATTCTNCVISGRVFDQATTQPLPGVCVYVGIPGSICWATTAADGSFSINMSDYGISAGSQWELYFKKAGYDLAYYGKFFLNGPYSIPPVYMVVSVTPPPPGACNTPRTDTPTQTVYLPNITRTLGGPTGWYTPFIVQNTGAANTDLEISFYKFSDGTCVSRLTVSALKPGTSYDNNPDDNGKNPTLPDDTQFSVVVRSFGSTVVGVVNEVQGSGDLSEAMAYDGFSTGATTVSLPNITRRFFGYVTPFIIQNLGTSSTTATAVFRPFDGSTGPVTVTRTIAPGAAKPIDPNSDLAGIGAPGLIDGKQYAVTVTSPQPVAAVVNTVNDAAGVAHPVALATDGVMSGAATIYGAYAAKNAQGIGRYTPIIVQNLGATAVTPTITFTPLAGSTGTATTYTFPAIQPGASKAFDPRFSFTTQGQTSPTACSGGAGCLADGEYAFSIGGGTGAVLAAQVNPVSDATAMGYSATATPAAKFFLPNITKSLCFCGATSEAQGWTTPIVLQSVTATSATLKWYRFSDGALMLTQPVTLTPGSGLRIDPWTLTALAAETQYSVVVDAGTSGTVTAIVTEFAPGGDNAMAYEGFPAP